MKDKKQLHLIIFRIKKKLQGKKFNFQKLLN